MQSLLEQWLRLMLNWDPTLRGCQYVDASDPGPVVAFAKLEQILQMKVVSIFWVDELSELCYPISKDTTVETIQEWIERDTGISHQYQLMILPRGTSPNSDRTVCDILVENEPIFAYLFSKMNDGSECKIIENYPELVALMLSNPRRETEYRMRKQMWSKSVFFLQKQTILHRRLISASKVIS